MNASALRPAARFQMWSGDIATIRRIDADHDRVIYERRGTECFSSLAQFLTCAKAVAA